MSKTISLIVDGERETYTGIEQVNTALLATDTRQNWIPKDEAIEHFNLVDITPTANGIYRIAKEGETAQTIYHDDGTVEQIIEADGIKSVTPNVPGTVTGLTTDKNGTYDAKNHEGVSADGFNELEIDVDPNIGQITLTREGYYSAETYGLDGFSKVIVKVQDAPEEPYQLLYTEKNGSFIAEDRNAFGFFQVDVNVQKSNIIPGLWVEEYNKTFGETLSQEAFRGAPIGKHLQEIHMIAGNYDVIYDMETSFAGAHILPREFRIDTNSRPCLVEHGGTLHLLGGNANILDEDKDRQHYIYRPTGGLGYGYWEKDESLPVPPVSAVEYRGEIWIYTADGKLMRCRTGVWSVMYEVENAAPNAKICVYNDRIYIIGGAVEIISYDPMTGARYEVANLPYIMSDPNLIVHNDKIRIMSSLDGVGVDAQYDKRYMTDLSFDGRLMRYESQYIRQTQQQGLQSKMLVSDFTKPFEYNGTLYAMGTPRQNDGKWYVWRLEEIEI